MKKISETIVFFGSGPVAAKSLELLAKDFYIEAVITKPKAPHHRGSVPVIEQAIDLNIPVYTAHNKRTLNELFETESYKSKVAVLIDFGIIVDQPVIDYFQYGIINSHFSLLPEWRGADPITFSILSGQQQTGVSLMLLTAGMDEGPLLAQAPYDISPDITTPSLTADLIDLSHSCLAKIVPLWLQDKTTAQPQKTVTMAGSTKPTYSRKLTKEDGFIDWNKSARELEREIRAFIEWPKSKTRFGELEVIITKAHTSDAATGEAGTVTIIERQPIVFCGSGALVLDLVKPAGKKEMTGEAFLAGHKQTFLDANP